ncbi:unnamed protein product [Anisakis simplex]|uniref:Secreted protein n=1 Tax=Anisakis simplex TaxID=6269 RepID=A0A0M3JXG9_ANISI|nr:unnamed protein product [Anisakis simplex]
MVWLSVLLFCSWTLNLVSGQPPPIANPGENAVLVENAQKLMEWYGIATQLMNLGGSIINNAKDRPGYGSSGNGIIGDMSQPQQQASKNYGASSLGLLKPLSDYGGGALGTNSNQFRSAKQSGLESLLNTFLGSSVSSSPSSPDISNFFAPSYSPDYHSSSGSNIENLINSLIRGGAKQATPDTNSSPNLLSQFFG